MLYLLSVDFFNSDKKFKNIPPRETINDLEKNINQSLRNRLYY